VADRIRVFQIFYDDRTRASLDREFEPLDNSRNERPDWYEYWPIRGFLETNPLDESTYYGFLSPRFAQKTGLAGGRVKDFVQRAGGTDVVTFSPFPEHAACFLNLFEQGDLFHPGLAELATRFFAEADPAVRFDRLVNHSRNAVLANYFVAKPRFWRRWNALLDRCFSLAETATTALGAALNAVTVHHARTGPQLKIFLMERVASTLLADSRGFSVSSFPPFEMAFSHPFFNAVFAELLELDALKIALSATGDPHYLKCYRALQRRILESPGSPWREAWLARSRDAVRDAPLD
jgi:hypothetical protein